VRGARARELVRDLQLAPRDLHLPRDLELVLEQRQPCVELRGRERAGALLGQLLAQRVDARARMRE